MQYAILDKVAWDHQTEELSRCPGVLIVDVTRLGAHVQERTGRAHVLANGNVLRKLRAGERVYVRGLRGVLVQKVST